MAADCLPADENKKAVVKTSLYVLDSHSAFSDITSYCMCAASIVYGSLEQFVLF